MKTATTTKKKQVASDIWSLIKSPAFVIIQNWLKNKGGIDGRKKKNKKTSAAFSRRVSRWVPDTMRGCCLLLSWLLIWDRGLHSCLLGLRDGAFSSPSKLQRRIQRSTPKAGDRLAEVKLYELSTETGLGLSSVQFRLSLRVCVCLCVCTVVRYAPIRERHPHLVL